MKTKLTCKVWNFLSTQIMLLLGYLAMASQKRCPCTSCGRSCSFDTSFRSRWGPCHGWLGGRRPSLPFFWSTHQAACIHALKFEMALNHSNRNLKVLQTLFKYRLLVSFFASCSYEFPPSPGFVTQSDWDSEIDMKPPRGSIKLKKKIRASFWASFQA